MTKNDPQTQPNPVIYPDRYFLGITTAARPDWEEFFREPTATRSSKAESVQKEVAEKRAKQTALAPTAAVSGTVLSAVLVDQHGKNAFESNQPTGDLPGAVSCQLLSFLSSALGGNTLFVGADRFLDTQVRLFGFRIRDRLKLIAMDALRYCRLKNLATQIPVGLWYHRPFESGHYLDPYEVFIGTDMRGDVDFAGVCDFLRIPRPTDQQLLDPYVQAELARQFALVGQMFITQSE